MFSVKLQQIDRGRIYPTALATRHLQQIVVAQPDAKSHQGTETLIEHPFEKIGFTKALTVVTHVQHSLAHRLGVVVWQVAPRDATLSLYYSNKGYANIIRARRRALALSRKAFRQP